MVTGSDSRKSVVYVLGAGASAAVIPAAPLMAQLLPEALKMFELQEYFSRGHWNERVRRIKDFIADFYHSPLNPDTLPNLEDILTQLDDALLEGRPLSYQYDIPFLRTLREDFVYTISEVLRQALDDAEVMRGDLMKWLICRLGPNDCILSLNYDIIADNALYQHIRPRQIDYGLPVRYSLESAKRRKRYILQRSSSLLYKLHGSLNWLYCPSCQQLDITIGLKGVRYIYEGADDFVCPDCYSRYEPLIITPTLLKTYNNILLREVWRQAEDKVSQADEVVFIGYSLPDADVQLRCMLLRALYKNRIRSHIVPGATKSCKICVVGNSLPNSETHKRYLKLFGEVEYHGDGFRGYMEQLER